eukprot:TRINITY_DN11813_c0_g1_i1.p1 TRINITY_DN11813_c0_g1~~TRINITY_DN11813_c0_g1_i1.p1  ORF type:complete len:444 (+),score=105.09 TRINITY_DN11813_c0_g1_i1:1339-2670(+)
MASADFRERMQSQTARYEDVLESAGCIGRGTYGVVYKVYRKPNSSHRPRGSALRQEGDDIENVDRPYALKGMVTSVSRHDGFSIAAVRELSLLREVRHENVIMMREIFFDHTRREIWLLFDFAEYDLWWLTQKYKRPDGEVKRVNRSLPDRMIKTIMWQLLNGVHYLHENWILHRDLKPGNVFLTTSGVLKIGDLGMARIFQSPPQVLTVVDPIVVTYWYRSPELMLGVKHYTKAIDVWSIGCIFAELIILEPLFYVQNDQPGRDPYYAKQLEAIFQIMGKPVLEPDRTDREETHWPDLKHMPRYDDFQRDFKDKIFKRSLAKKLLTKNTADHRFRLLKALLRLDPTQRYGTKKALEDRYFTDGGAPTSSCFDHCDIEFPRRPMLDPSKNKMQSDAPSNLLMFRGVTIEDKDKGRVHSVRKHINTTTSTIKNGAPDAKRSKRR